MNQYALVVLVMHRIKLASIFILFLLSTLTHATVGGSDGYEVLGLDPVEKKVFYTIIDGDGSGYVDRLYYFNLKSKNAKPIFAKSFYENKDFRNCEDSCRVNFERKIDRLKKRLKPMQQLSTDRVSWSTDFEKQRTIEWYSGGDDTPPFENPTDERTVEFTVRYRDAVNRIYDGQGNMVYINQKAKISALYAYNSKPTVYVAIMTYLGKAYEFGYDKHELILLK